MAGLLAVLSETVSIDLRLSEQIPVCVADNPDVDHLLRINLPDVLVLVGAMADHLALIARFRQVVPWGYVVALWENRPPASPELIDEIWALSEHSHLHDRLLALRRLAELNRAWQTLPEEARTQLAEEGGMSLFSEGRLLSPRRAGQALLMSSLPDMEVLVCSLGQQLQLQLAESISVWSDMAATLQSGDVSFRQQREGNGPLPFSLRLLGADFPLGKVLVHRRWRSRPFSRVAEASEPYRGGEAALPADGGTRAILQQWLSSVNHHYQLQVERLRSATTRQEVAQLKGQISHHDQLALAGELAAGIAHEIRNPLTAVRGFIQLLRQRLAKAGLSGEMRYTDYILEEIDRANQIITDFLTVARPKAEQWGAVDLSQLLQDMAQLVQHQATLQDIRLEVQLAEPLPGLRGKAEALKQVFLNLLTNALQATPSGGSVSLSCRMDGAMVVAEVSDTGEGIDPDQLPRIFEPFFTTKQGGTGLGLAICREIVEAHGGQISATSRRHVGSCFTVRLPLRAAAQ